mmetsp:Transcript_36961/g.73147  ORF Transcript_36961/g.73147 Transcript_36961/m.73147 type:complete len:523 (-) Transcript_36961:2-1570(-)
MNVGKREELAPLLSGCQRCPGLRCICGKMSPSGELQTNQQMQFVRKWAMHRVQADPYFKIDPILVIFPSAHSPTNVSPRRPKSQQSSPSKQSNPEVRSRSTGTGVSTTKAADVNLRKAAADAFYRNASSTERSACVQDAFHDLRRAAWEHKDEQGPDESLVNATLRDTEDSTETLSTVLARLEALQDPVLMAGSARHATALVSGRALAVVQRKRDLIESCEERIASFANAQKRRKEILQDVIEGEDPPKDLFGIDKFVASKTHKGGVNPADANKSDFQAFAQTFGMPPRHQCFRRLKKMAIDATVWWAQKALHQAQVSDDMMQTHRLLEMSENIIGRIKNSYIIEAKKVLGSAMAEHVLKNCREIKRKDEELVKWTARAQPESARTCVELINSQIKIAVSMGASPKHDSLAEAKHLSAQLSLEEKARLAQRALERARARKEAEEREANKCSGIPPVGPASQVAELIYKEVKSVVADGALRSHPSIQEALKIAKEMLDLDVLRRRLLAREKRLLAKKEKQRCP